VYLDNGERRPSRPRTHYTRAISTCSRILDIETCITLYIVKGISSRAYDLPYHATLGI
jgi:hypothetical protein